MELLDTDGDRIDFFIDARGKLREYVNGKLELAEVLWFEYSKSDGSVRDATGVFHLQEGERVEKALGLRALAARASVAWRGDEPVPAQRLVLTDTDGDRLEFSITDAGQLQELLNGVVELSAVTTLRFSFAEGTVNDDSGVFTLPARECLQKVAVLRSLAAQAGVPWYGDEPSRPRLLGSEPTPLDIENCASDWEFQCPRRWEGLTATLRPNERFCETCKETVYHCGSEEELREHTAQRRCVAFDVREPAAAPGSTAGAAEAMGVRIVRLSGDELPRVSISPSETVRSLKKAVAIGAGIPVEEQRLLLEGCELLDDTKLSEAAVSPKVALQLLRVPRPGADAGVAHVPQRPPRRMMGKRVVPRARGLQG